MQEKLAGNESELSEKRTLAESLQQKNESITANLAALRQTLSGSQEDLSGLEDDYSDLRVKYDKLVKPARSSKNKHVVDFRYTSQLGDDRFVVKRPGDSEFSPPMTLEAAERVLQSIVVDHCKDLYVRIVFPQREPLSHQKAWALTSRLHKYDYYHRSTPCK